MQSCIALECLSSLGWQEVYQSWNIHNKDVCLRFLVCWYNMSCDFWQLYSLPPLLSATGNACYSCWKNSFRSHSPLWQGMMNSFEHNLQSSIGSFCFDSSAGAEYPQKKSTLVLLIGSYKEAVLFSKVCKLFWNFIWLLSMCDWGSAAELGWATFSVSSEYKSWLSSWKGLPMSCRDCDSLSLFQWKSPALMVFAYGELCVHLSH